MIIKAPAKINLTLEILKLRPDGYHGVRTIMQSVGIFDTINIRPLKTGEIKLKCEWIEKGIPEPAQENNLAYRAAALLKYLLDEKRGAKITLKKLIPAGAGLGGGSSDAAAVLTGLCKFWNKKVPAQTLNKLAAKLGADVSFFLTCGCCLAEGAGEKITPLKTPWDNKPLWFVIVKPEFSTSTKEIYNRLDAARRKIQNVPTDSIVRSFKNGRADYRRIKSGGFLRLEDINFINDLERAAVKMHPAIEKIKKRLLSLGASVSMMSGSGSAVFGIFHDAVSAKSAAAHLKKTHLKKTAVFTALTV